MSKQFDKSEYFKIVERVQKGASALDQLGIALRSLFDLLQVADPKPEIEFNVFLKDAFRDIVEGVLKEIAQVIHAHSCLGCMSGKNCGDVPTIH